MTRASTKGRRTREEEHASLLFAVPLALVYHVGLLITDVRNGADTLTSALLFVVDRSLFGYVALLVALAGALYGLARRLEARGSFHFRDFPRLLAEAAVLGLGMRLVVSFVTAQILSVPLFVGTSHLSPLDVLVVSSGAGFHEEVVFRAGFFAGGTALLTALGIGRVRALVTAAMVSSLLFSIAHYVGAFGDVLSLSSFVFRVLAGLYLVVVFHLRGFAVAAWTHALYDIGVLI